MLLSLLLVSLPSPASASGDLSAGLEREARPEPSARSAPGASSDFDRLARGFMVSLLGKPFLFSTEDLDRIVGDPWTLNAPTQAKLDALPPRLRLRLYSVLAGHLAHLRLEPRTGLWGTRPGDERPLQIEAGAAEGRDTLWQVGRALDGYFRAEELGDLAVFALSRNAFFPKTHAGWTELEQHLVGFDLGLGLLALAALSSVDEGNLEVGGWALRNSQDTFRAGWFAGLRHLGLSARPVLSTGLRAAMPGFEASLSFLDHVRPGEGDESRTIELLVRERLLQATDHSERWELTAQARGLFFWEHTDPALRRSLRAELEVYARRPGFWSRPELDLLVETRLSSDFTHTHSADLSVGLEDRRHAVAGAVRLTATSAPGTRTEVVLGAVLGGTIGELRGDDGGFRELEAARNRLRAAIGDSRAADGGGHAGPWDQVARTELRRRAEDFWRARERCAQRRRPQAGPQTIEEASLQPGALSEADARYLDEKLGARPAGERLRTSAD
ncbi:MAG TPA: hypothetical protein VGK67_27650 [Myxococcales bacterium]